MSDITETVRGFIRLARKGDAAGAFARIKECRIVDVVDMLGDLADQAPTDGEKRFIESLEMQLLDHLGSTNS